MTASRPELARRRRPHGAQRALLAAGLLAAHALAVGCHTPSGVPFGSLLEPLAELPSTPPDEADYAAVDLAAAALVSDRETAVKALARLELIDEQRAENGEKPTRLVPVGLDVIHATLGSDRAYREAARELLRRDDLDPALRARLKLAVEDDPLLLASARIRDQRMASFGKFFNAVAQTVGTSVINLTMAPVKLARMALSLTLSTLSGDRYSFRERQALVQWKHFLRKHPAAEEAPEIQERVAGGQAEWDRQLRDEHLVRARRALAAGQYGAAEFYAQRALEFVPGDRAAEKLRAQAAARHAEVKGRRDASLAAPPPGSDVVGGAIGRSLALSLLVPDSNLLAEARAVVGADPDGPLADEASYSLALAYRETGSEWAMWETLGRLAKSEPEQSNMARHAAALTRTPDHNPYRAFAALRREDRKQKVGWILVGPYANGFPERRIPAPLQWMVETPLVVQGLMGAPMRLLQAPWLPPLPTGQAAASAARDYLARFPNGDHTEEIRDWLESFESKRGNWLGALRVAEDRPRSEADELDELQEKAAEQALKVARGERRQDVRGSLLREVARGFPETEAGHQAGERARAEALEATQQRIRISRGFLQENPEVAGPRGVGLNPELLDEKVENGELHPRGITLLGGKRIEIALVADSGDEDDEPKKLTRTVSDERLSRLVARLDETTRRNALADPDNDTAPDAHRDHYFEYARLGIAEEQSLKPGSGSSFEFLGMRERYGLVRSREPLLPFDFVFQASPYDWSLGAFPRMREPKRTPDWMLYK